MQPIIYYCYDAYCGWCFGFSPVIKKLAADLSEQFHFEVLSGGMIPINNAPPLSATANYILSAYPRVEELTGVKFGEDYLWHLRNPDKTDWYPHSQKAAIALSIFKEQFPEQQVEFAADLQQALYGEGRDLTDDEAYRHLLEKYAIDDKLFYQQLHSVEYKEKALYEFALCKQLQVTGFPALLLQTSESKFYMLASGYTSYQDITMRLKNILEEIK